MPNEAPALSETTLILDLEFGQVSNRKKLSSETTAVDTQIDRSMLHISVDMFDAPELKACQSFLVALRGNIKARTVPACHLRGGMYLVKMDAMSEIDEVIEKAKVDFRPLVQAFADVVEQRRDEAKERLGAAYDATKYPTREQVMAIYKISHSWMTVSTPGSLKKLNRAIYEREVQKAEENLRVAVEDITTMLALEAKKLADHMVDRLTPGADGKQKIFRDSIVSNITDFLANFNMRNIGTSDELDAQVTRIRALIEGVNPDDLRKSDQLREDVAIGFSKVAESLDKIVTEKPFRFLDFGKA